jgi:hypothetical protein
MIRTWKYTGLLFMAVLALGMALVASGHSVQADAPSDNITSPVAQGDSGPLVEQQEACNNINDGGVLETTASYIKIEVDCWHSGDCQVCDENRDYSCSPDEYCWISPCQFSDPLPPDSIVTKIDVEVRGVPCSGEDYNAAYIKVYVNDTLVGEGLEIGNCYCDECWPLSVSSDTYASFPGYVYGGNNNLGLDIQGSSCISNVYVTLYYHQRTSAAPKVSPTLSRPLDPPQMSVQYLSVNPNQTAAGQPVTIATNVVNTGDQAGSLNVALKINGQVEETRMISVGPLASQPVKFTVSKSQPGTYAVDILGQESSFTVLDSGASNREPVNGAMIAILATGILAVAVAVLIILSYKQKTN